MTEEIREENRQDKSSESVSGFRSNQSDFHILNDPPAPDGLLELRIHCVVAILSGARKGLAYALACC